MLASESITVIADGQEYLYWTEVTVIWHFSAMTMTFELMATEILPEPFGGVPGQGGLVEYNFPTGTSIVILGNGDLLCAGFTNEYRPSVTPTTHTVRVVGRTFMQDFVDSSVKMPNQFFGLTICELMKRLAGDQAHLVECRDGMDEVIGQHHVRQGATRFQEAMRILPQRGMTLMALPQGGAALIGPNTQLVDSGGALIEGLNMLSMSGEITDDELFREYEVIGQASQGIAQEDFEINASAFDPRQRSSRYKKLLSQHDVTRQEAEKRANLERMRATGVSVKAKIQTPGFRVWHASGNSMVQGSAFWQPHSLVYVWSPSLKIDCYMFIQEVRFHQDDKSGTTTTLTVSDPATSGSSVGEVSRCNSTDMWRF